MISNSQLERMTNLKRDLDVVMTDQSFRVSTSDSVSLRAFEDAKGLAQKWIVRVEEAAHKLDDSSVSALVLYTDGIIRTVQHDGRRAGESVQNGMARITADFKATLPVLIYELLESAGFTELSDEDFPKRRAEALAEIGSAQTSGKNNIEEFANLQLVRLGQEVDQARIVVRQEADEAAKDLELIKANARHISVGIAQKQFEDASHRLTKQKWFWVGASSVFFCSLLFLLIYLPIHPPPLISAIINDLHGDSIKGNVPISVPLLIAGSAYFTSLRLAIIGVLGVGLAFSLRMMSAYFHMIEHNEHRLRVTNSIEVFVAAVLTDTQKDLILGKLVESVTEFGDSGILGKNAETPSFPSVIFDSITKNVGKSG